MCFILVVLTCKAVVWAVGSAIVVVVEVVIMNM